MTDKPVTANHYIGFAFGWLFTALIIFEAGNMVGNWHGRKLEREEISRHAYKCDSVCKSDSVIWERHRKLEGVIP